MEPEITQQSLTQKKIALAQSEHASIIVELIKDCMTKNTQLIADTEWKTLVNALTLEIESNLIISVSQYIEKIRQGYLYENK